MMEGSAGLLQIPLGERGRSWQCGRRDSKHRPSFCWSAASERYLRVGIQQGVSRGHAKVAPAEATPCLPTAMQAIVYDEPGGPEVLHTAQIPVPTPGPTELLLRFDP